MEEENKNRDNKIDNEKNDEKIFSTSLILLGVVVFTLIIVFSIFRFC